MNKDENFRLIKQDFAQMPLFHIEKRVRFFWFWWRWEMLILKSIPGRDGHLSGPYFINEEAALLALKILNSFKKI